MKKKKILITGGCGFIGSSLAIFLKKKNFIVHSLDNLSRNGSQLNLKRIKKFNIRNFKIDVLNKENLFKLPKYDLLIDCSALVEANVKINNITKVLSTNFFGTNNLLLKCIKDNSRFFFLSTSRVYSIQEVYKFINNKKNIRKKITKKNMFIINEKFSTSTPLSFYGLSKKFSEELIKEYSHSNKVKYLINRFGVIAGPWQFGKVEQGFFSYWIWRHLRKRKLVYKGFGGLGYQIRDILHVEDACEIIYRQIQKFSKIHDQTFNVGGGIKNAIDLNDMTYISRKITKNKIDIGSYKKTDSSDIPMYISDNNKVKKLYNWKPKKSILEVGYDVYDWQKKNLKLLKKYMK